MSLFDNVIKVIYHLGGIFFLVLSIIKQEILYLIMGFLLLVLIEIMEINKKLDAKNRKGVENGHR